MFAYLLKKLGLVLELAINIGNIFSGKYTNASSNGLVDTTDLLLRNGADPSIQNNDGHTYKDVESRGYDYDLDL